MRSHGIEPRCLQNAPMQLYFTLCKADIREDDGAPELEQMPQLTREASPLKSETPNEVDEPPSKAPAVPTFTVALNNMNTKLLDMSQTQSSHPPIITTSSSVGAASSSSSPSGSAPAVGRRQKRKPSSPLKKTKTSSPTSESPLGASNGGSFAPNGIIRADSKSGSKLSSDSTSSTPSPAAPPLQRMVGAPPTAKAPVSPAMMKAALENAKRTCYNFTGQLPPDMKKPKISPLAAKPPQLGGTHSNGGGGSGTGLSDSAKNTMIKSMLNRPLPPVLTAQTTVASDSAVSKNGGAMGNTSSSSRSSSTTPVTFTSSTSSLLPPPLLSTGRDNRDNQTVSPPNGTERNQQEAAASSRSSAPPLTAMVNTNGNNNNNNVYGNTTSPSNPPPLLSINMPKSIPVTTAATFGLVVVSDPQALFRSSNTASSSSSAVPLISR